MPAPFSLAERAPMRLAAVAGAAALGVGAFALPAHAQITEPEITFDYPETLEAGAGFAPATLDIEFGDDFEPDTHKVTALLKWENQSEMHYGGVSTDDGFCGMDATYHGLSCIAFDADGSLHFELEYGALGEAQPGDYEFSLTVMIDDETITTVEGYTEIVAAAGSPFSYSPTDLEIESGSTVETAPGFYQNGDLPADTAALVYGVSSPDYILTGTAEATAPYDNCVDGFDGGPGVTCVVTDFPDQPGATIAPTRPVEYTVFREVPGPVQLCVCYYEVRALNAEELEAEFGDVPTDGEFGLEVVAEGDPSDFTDWGAITVTTTPHPFDLAVEDANIKGDNGDEVTVTIPVANLGPADAWSFLDGPGSYALVGELPKGTEFVSASSDDSAYCQEFSDENIGETVPAIEDRDAADFICIFTSIPKNDSYDVELKVKVTDENADTKGVLQVVAFNNGYPGEIEVDLDENTADLTLNGRGSGQLPTTGSSMTWILSGATAALVAGAAMFILTRRKAAAE